ncbi:hypothetical protein ElyMa_005776400 [Elysia marginata]|uniref:Uncharacterized protein n=1 Tax=Elysia marginata TaxID=1093978 RepID=A0AAV4FRW8_9GAST|nr:hypothetical protein ElyMa_005776400 [Elysia marginata]
MDILCLRTESRSLFPSRCVACLFPSHFPTRNQRDADAKTWFFHLPRWRLPCSFPSCLVKAQTGSGYWPHSGVPPDGLAGVGDRQSEPACVSTIRGHNSREPRVGDKF